MSSYKNSSGSRKDIQLLNLQTSENFIKTISYFFLSKTELVILRLSNMPKIKNQSKTLKSDRKVK